MGNILSFGEKIEEYDVTVLNEREVRASAGILFLAAITSFFNSWLIGNFFLTKIFVTVFLLDFFMRIFVNPKYSPSLVIGRFMVRGQKVEYVGAPQKRFAWSIGFVLAVVMFYLVVMKGVIGPVNLLICFTCLSFLFFESAFGICIGCIIYNMFHRTKAELCPGNACDISEREEIQYIDIWQLLVVIIFAFLIYFFSTSSFLEMNNVKIAYAKDTVGESVDEDCVVPDFAIKMGHEEQWKLHHGCK